MTSISGRSQRLHRLRLPTVVFAITLFFLVAACTGSSTGDQTATPQSTQDVLHLGLSVSAGQAIAGIDACRDLEGTALIVEQFTDFETAVEEFDLVLSLGAPAGAPPHAAALAEDRMAIIVPNNAGDPQPLSLAALKSILSGGAKFWSQVRDGGRLGSGQIELWSYPEGHPLREHLTAGFGVDPPEIQSQGLLVPHPEAMVAAVAAGPGRVGYIPASWLTGTVVEVPLEDRQELIFSMPLLIHSGRPFEGNAYGLVDCLQNGLGQEALLDFFSPYRDR